MKTKINPFLNVNDRDDLIRMAEDRHKIFNRKPREEFYVARDTGCKVYESDGLHTYLGQPLSWYIENYGEEKGRAYAEERKNYCQICGKEIGALLCNKGGGQKWDEYCNNESCGYFKIRYDKVKPLSYQDAKIVRKKLKEETMPKQEMLAILQKEYRHFSGVCKKKRNIFDNRICDNRTCRKVFWWWWRRCRGSNLKRYALPEWEPWNHETKKEYQERIGILIAVYYLRFLYEQKKKDRRIYYDKKERRKQRREEKRAFWKYWGERYARARAKQDGKD